MNILLLYPEMPDTIGKLKYIVELSGRKSCFPPIGLLTVAAMLPKDWQLKIIDLNTDTFSPKDLLWPDYVFISAMNVQSKSAREVIEICRKANVKTVAGGTLFTHEYEKFDGVTHFVLNEAEITLPLFLEDLQKGEAKHIYKSPLFADVTTTPPPMWELIDLNKYLYSIVQYSRGCPYLCDFCDVTTLYGRVPRVKPSDNIIKELNLLITNKKNEMIFFADDNLIGNKNLLKKELLPALIEWRNKNPYAPTFATQLTITLADDEELMLMLREAGFRHILIGIESLDTEALIKMRKKQNINRNILENVKLLQSWGFIIIGTFIVGLDSDTKENFDYVANFIQESGIVFAIVNILKAPVGTELYDRMKRENRLIKDFEFNEDKTNIIPVMDEEELQAGYKSILEKIYDPKNVVERALTFFENLNPPKVANPILRKLSVSDALTFLRIIFNVGLFYSNRRYFWKLLFWTLKNKPNHLDLTLLYTVTMYQYSNLFESFIRREKEGKTIYSGQFQHAAGM